MKILRLLPLLALSLFTHQALAQTYGSAQGQITSPSSMSLNGVFAFAGLPSAATYVGYTAYTSDQGLVYSNGTTWVSAGSSGGSHSVACTGGSTGATDAALLAAAAVVGGNINLTANCVVNATTALISNTYFNGNGYKITAAAAANWPSSTIKAALDGALGTHDVTVANTTFDWTGAAQNIHVINFAHPPSPALRYKRISVLNNRGLNVKGDFAAIVNALDVTVTGNNINDSTQGCIGACIDLWGTEGNIIVTGNTTYVAGLGIGIIYTGFYDTSNPTNVVNANISHNMVYILDQVGGVAIGIYIQGHETDPCTWGVSNDAFNTIADNQILISAGVIARPIWVNSCAYYTDVHDNIFTSDGVTVNTAPAIQANGAALTNALNGIQMHDNLGYGFLAQPSGNDDGVFQNKSFNGSIINNKCFHCSAKIVGTTGLQSTTIVYGNDGGTTDGTGTVNFVSPVNFAASSNVPSNTFNWGVPSGIGPSGFFANNGVYVIGQAPSSSATLSLSAATGSVTATFSAATLLGTAADVGRVITVLDTTYKYCTITAQSSTTVATCTISGGNWSGTGPFANNILWLSGTPTTNTTAFSVPLPTVFSSGVYMWFAANTICTAANCGAGASQTVGLFYLTCESTTVCTVKNPVGTASGTPALVSGKPTIPASTTAYTSTGPGAFTQSLAAQNMLVLPIAGNSIGPGGSLVYDILALRNNNADTVALQTFYGGSQVSQLSVVSVLWYGLQRTIRNMGVTNAQFSFSGAGSSSQPTDIVTASAAPTFLAIDSTASQNLSVKGVLSTAGTDWLFTMGGTAVANYSP